MKNLLTSLLLMLPCFVAAQIYTYPLVDSLPNNAQVYHLPKTGLNICFTIRHSQETPGELARYAERFLGQIDVITEAQNTQEITAVEAHPFTIADPDKRFYMVTKVPEGKQSLGKKQVANAPALHLTCNKDGILLAVNAEAKTNACQALPQNCQALPKNCQGKTFSTQNNSFSSQAYLTQEMKLANSSMKMAELAARQIFSIRETRQALLHGELENYPTDGEGFKLFLQELNQLEQQYLELFIGTRQEEIYQYQVQYVPGKESTQEVVCRFSSQKGLLDKDDLSGRPIYCLIEAPSQPIIQTPDSISRPGNKKNEIIKSEEPAGLYYYLPEQVNITLKDGTQTLWQQRLMLAQMGQLLKLKTQENMSLLLDVHSGAIIQH